MLDNPNTQTLSNPKWMSSDMSKNKDWIGTYQLFISVKIVSGSAYYEEFIGVANEEQIFHTSNVRVQGFYVIALLHRSLIFNSDCWVILFLINLKEYLYSFKYT